MFRKKKGGMLMDDKYVATHKSRPDRVIRARKAKKVFEWVKMEVPEKEIKVGDPIGVRKYANKPGKFYRSEEMDFITFQRAISSEPPSHEKLYKFMIEAFNTKDRDAIGYIRDIGKIMNRYGSVWNKNYEAYIANNPEFTPTEIFDVGLKEWFDKRYNYAIEDYDGMKIVIDIEEKPKGAKKAKGSGKLSSWQKKVMKYSEKNGVSLKKAMKSLAK